MNNIWILFIISWFHRPLARETFYLVSGVVLANASLDIAFHDRIILFFHSGLILLYCFNHFHNIQKFKVKYDDEYIKKFWVGLMDGDGSIQVNHWRRKILQYRLVIKLSYLPSGCPPIGNRGAGPTGFNFPRIGGEETTNYEMLVLIAKVIGGTVRVSGNDVLWVVDDKSKIIQIIKIFEVYPPLTSKKICQLKFLQSCLEHNCVDTYLSSRNNKYEMQNIIINSPFNPPLYFKEWLSGFVEAEGCFSLRKNGNHSFSIGQNDDKYIIEAIKTIFKMNSVVRNPYSNFYSIEVYKKDTLFGIISFFYEYPLMGEKLRSFVEFEKRLK